MQPQQPLDGAERRLAVVHGRVQHYEWGRLGSEASLVALLYRGGCGAVIDPYKPYAELWVGTHPKAPSDALLGAHKQPLEQFLGGHLPFLFKVLCVRRPLSVQAHPDKALAEALHAALPTVYTDANHKPEMALPLSTMEAMCGFRPPHQIAAFLKAVPELREVVGEEAAVAFEDVVESVAADVKPALRRLFTALMEADPSTVKQQLDSLIDRLQNGEKTAIDQSAQLDIDAILLRLSKEFPGDVGIFCPFFLNLLRLSPGKAIFLAANEPHAYLSGDMIECMACSDNVVRAGLTPKLRDAATLCSMLTYSTTVPEVMSGEAIDAYTKAYSPPVSEFHLLRTDLPSAAGHYSLSRLSGASLLLCYSGQGTVSADDTTLGLLSGSVVAITEDTPATLCCTGEEDLVVFRCSTNPQYDSA